MFEDITKEWPSVNDEVEQMKRLTQVIGYITKMIEEDIDFDEFIEDLRSSATYLRTGVL